MADRRWEPFQVMDKLYEPKAGVEIDVPEGLLVLKNNLYQVMVRQMDDGVFGTVWWLSVKRIDREPIHDWRDLQRIKNEIAGPECEAVEIYPPESKLVDTSNQYHLWAFVEGFQFAFTFAEREVIEHPENDPRSPSARQRPWYDSERPEDAK